MSWPPIAVTGMGWVNAWGRGEKVWDGLLAGVSCGGELSSIVEDEKPRALAMARRAMSDALGQAGISPQSDLTTPREWGLTVSTGKPQWDGQAWRQPESLTHCLAQEAGVEGPVVSVVAACATGLHAVMTAAEWLGEGRCRYVLAGSAESSFHPLYLAGYERMGVLSPQGVMRPFDRRRDGFIVAEGAAVFVLERPENARARKAQPLGIITGWDRASDAHHAVRFNAQGSAIAGSLRRILAKAGRTPGQIDYVNAHGTATRLNDGLELQALADVFRGNLCPAISSTKGATGHLLGAAGSFELGVCIQSILHQQIPGTVHLEQPEMTDLNLVRAPQRMGVHRAATLSFGFGGVIGTLVVERA